jgi:ABC-type transporter Mla maintaining outer membrane lipid asymmetry ATPase subunit MlaF
MGEQLAVHCVGLRQAFGDTVAVDGVDLDVVAGSVSVCWAPTAPARPRQSA